jgi:hypothetical protein
VASEVPEQAVSASVSSSLLNVYVQEPAVSDWFPEQLRLRLPQVIAPVQVGVPEKVIELEVAAHEYPVESHDPEHVALDPLTFVLSVPLPLTSIVTVVVKPAVVDAVVHVPSRGLLLHPIPTNASTADASNPRAYTVERTASAMIQAPRLREDRGLSPLSSP